MVRKRGINRIVFIFDNFVIKIPRHYSHYHFLQGCFANWAERHYCKRTKNTKEYLLVSPSYFCSWFGLFQIQGKCIPLKRALTKQQKEKFKNIAGNDLKKQNFGYYRGKIVCLDYAHNRK